MSENPIVSLCIPTNGVCEWVFPVLKSIYQQEVDIGLYEIIITDNGDNQEFKNRIKAYSVRHANIVYAETNVISFSNEIEAFKRARGRLIKFVNHRNLLIEGTLQRFVDMARNYEEEKPIIYFANGVLKLSKKQYEYGSFDQFVRNLSYWSSWSAGMTIWKEDFDKLAKDTVNFNKLFPHTDILFSERNRGEYIIDNTVVFDEIPQGKRPKGTYDLFGAFGIEYPKILHDLLRKEAISNETFRYVADKNLEFIANLYWRYFVKKEYCSYDLDGLKKIFGVFYSRTGFTIKLIKHAGKVFAKKILKRQGISFNVEAK